MWIVFFVLLVLVTGVFVFLNQPSFGKLPRGERLERIQNSPNYREGKFQNLSPTIQITSDRSMFGIMLDFIFGKVEGLRPKIALPVIKTDLHQLDRNVDVMVWMGHSSLFIQKDGKRFLFDPTLVMASPVSFYNKPFKGTNIYTPDDIPDIDYLLITHDHWDHLDYCTIKSIENRIGKVICGLGVGEHFERWGFGKERIIELDWNEHIVLDAGIIIYALPARHFSGRGLSPNQTLWVSYMLQMPSGNIFISGDSGYDNHFSAIGEQFGKIDLAILENGQYDEGWKYIHMIPGEQVKAAKDLNADNVFTVHNSKYALGKHPWKEPLENMSADAEQNSINLLTPMIGEPVYLNDNTQTFTKWWESF